jgi:hypothetical protein
VPPSARSLRERLEVARRHVQQLQASGQNVAQQSNQGRGQPGQVTAPKATIGPSGAGGSTAGTSGVPRTGTPGTAAQGTGTQGTGQVAAPTSGGSTSDVVIADKRQTFQQILGLK